MSYNYDTYPCGHSKYGYLVKRNQGGASLLSRRVYGNKVFADSLEDFASNNCIKYHELKQVIKRGEDLYLVNLFDLGDDLASIRKSLQRFFMCGMIDTFKAYLDKTNLSENSKSAYLFAFKQLRERYCRR